MIISVARKCSSRTFTFKDEVQEAEVLGSGQFNSVSVALHTLLNANGKVLELSASWFIVTLTI